MSLSQEEPPESIDQELKEYLSRRFIDIDNLLSRASKYPERKRMPYKPQFGDIHYFGDPTAHDYDPIILSEGWYGFKEFATPTDPRTGFWNKFVLGLEALNTFTEAGYGGIDLNSSTAISNIDATQTFRDLIDVETRESAVVDSLSTSNSIFAVYLGMKTPVRSFFNESCNIWNFSTYDIDGFCRLLKENILKNAEICNFPKCYYSKLINYFSSGFL